MKRFLVTQRLTLRFHKVVDSDHVGGRDPRKSIDILRDEDPAIDPGEWTVESIGDKEIKATDRNLRMVLATATFLRTVAVRVEREADAPAAAGELYRNPGRDLEPNPTASNWWRSYSKTDDRGALETLRVSSDPSNVRPKPSFVADVSDLVAPDRSYHVKMDQAFETIRWMLATMTNYVDGHERADHALSVGQRGWEHAVSPIVSMDDLKNRIRHVLLAKSNAPLAEWREDLGFRLDARIPIPLPTYGDAAGAATGLWSGKSVLDSDEGALALVARHCVGCDLSTVLNNSHPKATRIAHAGVHVSVNGFSFDIHHGYPDEKHGSGWWRTLAFTREGETFCETLERALARLRAIVPDLEKQLGDRRVQAAKDLGILAA